MITSESSHRPEQIPVILVSGFLGAGKTTLMRRVIEDANQRGLKVSVIVNEFGVTNIDSVLLQDAELVSSVSGGCACCSGQEDFLEVLVDIADREGDDRPDVVVIEASGLADPLLMLDCLTVAHLVPLMRLGALLTVVDYSRLLMVRDEVAPLLVRQLQLADFIILNKIDISFEPKNKRTKIEDVQTEIQKLNQHAAIIPTKGCVIDMKRVWKIVEQKRPYLSSSHDGTEAPHAHYQTVACPLTHPVQRAGFEAVIREIDPRIWRIKGFLNIEGEREMFLFQYTGGPGGAHHLLEPFRFHSDTQRPPATLVFIGPDLDRDKILRDFSGSFLLKML